MDAENNPKYFKQLKLSGPGHQNFQQSLNRCLTNSLISSGPIVSYIVPFYVNKLIYFVAFCGKVKH